MTQDNFINLGTGYARRDEETGEIRVSPDSPADEITVWPSTAARLGEWLQDAANQEAAFYVYYRWNHRDHVVTDGDTLCSHNVNVPGPDSEDLKPFSEMTEDGWRILRGNWSDLCSQCNSIARRKEIWPEEREGAPDFDCPQCGDNVVSVEQILGGPLMAEHEDGRRHEIDFADFQVWRRGEPIH